MAKINKWFQGAIFTLLACIFLQSVYHKFGHTTAIGPKTFFKECQVKLSKNLYSNETI
jgi:hypothetical protein